MIWAQIFGMAAAAWVMGRAYRGETITYGDVAWIIFLVLAWPLPVGVFLYGMGEAAWKDMRS